MFLINKEHKWKSVIESKEANDSKVQPDLI